jgi:hypothetical protein
MRISDGGGLRVQQLTHYDFEMSLPVLERFGVSLESRPLP